VSVEKDKREKYYKLKVKLAVVKKTSRIWKQTIKKIYIKKKIVRNARSEELKIYIEKINSTQRKCLTRKILL